MSKAKLSGGELGWHFFLHDWRKQTNDKKVDTGLNLELSGMVREATQNSNDAKLDDNSRPAQIHYRLLLLSGPAKDKFLAAGQLREISDRIKAGTKNPHLKHSNSGDASKQEDILCDQINKVPEELLAKLAAHDDLAPDDLLGRLKRDGGVVVRASKPSRKRLAVRAE